MAKISVLFKPARKSKISSDLQYLGYYELNYHNLEKIEHIGKFKIDKVPYDNIGDVYDFVNINFHKDSVVIIMTAISNLFD